MSVFEVVIYNKEVRERVEAGKRHPNLDASWADAHHQEFKADTAEEARQKAERRFPESQGYVIVEVIDTEY